MSCIDVCTINVGVFLTLIMVATCQLFHITNPINPNPIWNCHGGKCSTSVCLFGDLKNSVAACNAAVVTNEKLYTSSSCHINSLEDSMFLV